MRVRFWCCSSTNDLPPFPEAWNDFGSTRKLGARWPEIHTKAKLLRINQTGRRHFSTRREDGSLVVGRAQPGMCRTDGPRCGRKSLLSRLFVLLLGNWQPKAESLPLPTAEIP